ncbi:MAG: helix-turn-helix domain-containing protein [Candidatus Buchananbacteria bacterium]
MANNINNILKSIGLSEEQVGVYLAGLELGPSSILKIAKKAGTKRPTTYKIIDQLIEKGLFFQIFKGKKRFFSAEEPDILFTSLKQKENQLKQIMPDLKSLQNINPNKPQVKYYEGVNGAIAVYEDILYSTPKGGELLIHTAIAGLYQILPKDYVKGFIRRRIQRKISARGIVMDSKEGREWQKHDPYEMRQIILIPEEKYSFFGDTEIYGDKVALISYKENFMAVVIESKEIANMQRFIFELAWKNLSSSQLPAGA